MDSSNGVIMGFYGFYGETRCSPNVERNNKIAAITLY